MPPSQDYLFRRAVQLQQSGQAAEAIAVYREVVAVDPHANAAWLNLAMLLQQRGSAEAHAAFAEFIRTAPPDHPMVGLAVTTLSEAGLPVPDSQYRDDGTDKPPTVQFEISTGGKRGLMVADNDSGVEPGLLLEALSEFIEADSWLDASLFLTRHPELASGLAFTLLGVYASQRDDPQMAHQAEVNLNVLNRAREVGLLAAFAEADQTPTEEFGRLVRAKREIEPVLRGLNGLTRGEVWRRLDDVPWLGRDDDTYLLLARYAEAASDERRAILADLRLMLERYARGETAPDADGEDHGPGQDLASALEQAAGSATDTGASQVARMGEDLLGRADGTLGRFWRVDVARITAQCYLRYGVAANDTAPLGRAEEILAPVAALPVTGSWQDVFVAVTRGQVAISLYEMTGEESALAEAAQRLASARQRVGRYRTYEAPILRVLASITTLQAERTGEAGLIRETVELLEAAERITPRTGMAWLVTETSLIRALLWMAGQGDQAAISRCEPIIGDLTRRFGAEPGLRGQVHEMAGRVASSRFRWTQDVADLDVAVQSYEAALDFPETGRADRAHLDNNLAFAFWRRHQASGDADDLEQARQHGEAAVRAMSSEAPMATLARRNLARVCTTLGTGEDDRRAAELFRLDLRVLPGGSDRTVAALNLALLLFQRAFAKRTDAREALVEAYAAYTEGIENLDPELMPWESVEFGDELGRLLLTPGTWQEATISFSRAIEGIEVLSHVIPVDQWGTEVGQKLDRIVQLGAYCAGRAGYTEQAVSWLETHRTRAMRNALRLDTSALTMLAAAGHDELARSYAARASEIRSYSRVQEGENGRTFLGQRLRILRDQLGQLSQRIRAVPGFERFGVTPDVQDAYRAATDGPLLYVAVTSLGGLAFIVDGTARVIDVVELPEIHADAVTEHGSRYLAALDAYRTNPSDEPTLRGWLTELDNVREWLWAALVEPLRGVLTAPRPVTFIPSGLLGLLPVNAAQNGDQRAIDVADWRLAPSAEALLAARQSAARADRTMTLAVLDPQPTDFAPLRWTEVEGAALQAQTGPLTRLAYRDATTEAVLRAMPNHTMLHFACHGTAYLNRPLDSYLALAEHAKLTLQTLTDEGRLWGARLCFLSACDSGVAGTAAPQEVVALPTALIQLGAAAVIASQWPVNDATAAVLALRFYQVCGEGMPPAAAFAQAQRWLCTATRSQISALLRMQADDVTDVGGLIADLPLVHLPFANVQDWAAFTYTGC
jgi:CHAT domain-containing protein/tetratricopeptide (TPR) repeat protein